MLRVQALNSARRHLSLSKSVHDSVAGAPLVLSPKDVGSLTSDTSDIVFLDASWHMPNSTRKADEEYLQQRIPGSRFFDLDKVASEHKLNLKHMMPSNSIFANALQSLGIRPSTHVIIYDSVGVFSSPRALFTFRAFGHHKSSIINGGLPQWQAEGHTVTRGTPEPIVSADPYPLPSLTADTIQSYEDITTNAKQDAKQDQSARFVLDARSGGRFLGSDPEPRPGLSSGHIPHSLSLPFNMFLKTNKVHDSDKTYTTLLPPKDITAALETALGTDVAHEIISGARKVTTSCGSGMTAAILWLGLKTINDSIPVSLYDESWTGYAMRPESKILVGED